MADSIKDLTAQILAFRAAEKPRRRERYPGKYPRRFEHKYKEQEPARYPETIEKVLASGKTPAGMHRPIMVTEVLNVLNPEPGQTAVDCTLGYGGHSLELLKRLQPNGRLLALDADPLTLPKTEARLRALGFLPDSFQAFRTNFAGLAQVLATAEVRGADLILADLGVSSMQIDAPARGFSFKRAGPLDMRMNPNRGQPASELVQRSNAAHLARLLAEHSDEPHAAVLGAALAGLRFATTVALAAAIRAALAGVRTDEREESVRRVFQALRIEVNDEFSALESLLRELPGSLRPGGRVAIITFHSGEDRRVKRAFFDGLRQGAFSRIATEVIRPSPEERRANPRSASAKLRWAIK